MTAYRLAYECGLHVVESRLDRFSGNGSTFLVRRFDRTDTDRRIHFASAMTMLAKRDGSGTTDGTSYLDIAQFISRQGAAVEEDLRELWTRMIFSIAISNTDDHLRNHGFLLTGQGWRLSPLYDVNPVPGTTGLSLNISRNDNSADFDLAISQARYFRIPPREAKATVSRITGIVHNWRQTAKQFGVSSCEMDIMAPAFSRCRTWP